MFGRSWGYLPPEPAMELILTWVRHCELLLVRNQGHHLYLKVVDDEHSLTVHPRQLHERTGFLHRVRPASVLPAQAQLLPEQGELLQVSVSVSQLMQCHKLRRVHLHRPERPEDSCCSACMCSASLPVTAVKLSCGCDNGCRPAWRRPALPLCLET